MKIIRLQGVKKLWSIALIAFALFSCNAVKLNSPNIEVYFVNQNIGWIIGPKLLQTKDGGKNWHVIQDSNGYGTFEAEYIGYAHQAIQFVTPEVGFQLSGNSIAKTTDGGVTWTTYAIPKPQNQDIPPQSLFFLSSQEGWIVGEVVYYTNDGGQKWVQLAETPLGDPKKQRQLKIAPGNADYLPTLWFTDSKNGMMIRLDGDGYITNDGGKTWTKSLSLGIPTRDVYFVDSQNGWLVGENGLIAKSSDAGKTWSVSQTITKSTLRSVFFINKQLGWVAGDEGTILFTTDGGLNWQPAEISGLSKPLPPLASISFVNEKNGFAVGGHSDPMMPSLSAPSNVILSTIDGGKTWKVFHH